jgi:hypothetical protein
MNRPFSQRGQRRNNNTNTNTNNPNTNTNTNNPNTRDLYNLLDTYSELYRYHINQLNQHNRILIDIKNTMDTINQTILSNSSNTSGYGNIGQRRSSINTNQTTSTFPRIIAPANRPSGSFIDTPNQSAVTRTSNAIINEILRSFLDPVPIRPTREQINAATTVRRFGDIEQPVNSSCPICMDVFNENDDVTQLFCGHIFTSSEIGRWFESHTRCPLCNVDIRDAIVTPSSNADTDTTNQEDTTTQDNDTIENVVLQDLRETVQPQENSRSPNLTNERVSNALTNGLMSWLIGDVDIGLSSQLTNGTNNLQPQWSYVGNDSSGSVIFETYLPRVRQTDTNQRRTP